jgi:exonuclease III
MLVNILTYNIKGLPWCRPPIKQICEWIIQQDNIDIICFQEAFTQKIKIELNQYLSVAGYTIIQPNDKLTNTWLPSGLVTFINKQKWNASLSNFQPFLTIGDVEIFANKGFQIIRLKNEISEFILVNTHLQSDGEFDWLIGTSIPIKIRKKQCQQIHEYCSKYKWPVLIVGDFNQPTPPHSDMKFLSPWSSYPLRKTTFPKTGEDIDHFAWIPSQWSRTDGRNVCIWCEMDSVPNIRSSKIHHDINFSDHLPIFMSIQIPTQL